MMDGTLTVVARYAPDLEIGLSVVLPDELLAFIAANGGDMAGKACVFQMDREQALVLADELRQAALAA